MCTYYGGYGKDWYENTIDTRLLIHRYNKTAPHQLKERFLLLKKLLNEVSENCIIEPPFYLDEGVHLKIGKGFYAAPGFTVLDSALITIGNHVTIGPKVTLTAAGHPVHPLARTSSDNSVNFLTGPIVIEDDVIIESNTIVLPNVRIGQGSVIGAGSVVNKDVPPMCYAKGVPCRVIRQF